MYLISGSDVSTVKSQPLKQPECSNVSVPPSSLTGESSFKPGSFVNFKFTVLKKAEKLL